MAIEFGEPTDELQRIANKLINDNFTHLSSKRVDFVFMQDRDKDGIVTVPTTKGKQIWGRASVVSGKNAYLAIPAEERQPQGEMQEPDKFFLVEICKKVWEFLKDEPRAREALLHHELMHCELDDNGKPTIRHHDVEEFNATVREYGLWKHDVLVFLNAAAEKMPLLKLMELQTKEDDAFFDAIEVEIGGRKQRITRADLMTWWQQIDIQRELNSDTARAREFAEKLKKKMSKEGRPGDTVTFEYKGKKVEV